MIPFELAFKVMKYPAGESHVRIGDYFTNTGDVILADRVRSFEDLGNVVTADRIMRRMGREVSWFIPYFPFARHDRRRDEQDGLELEFAFEMLKGLRVTTLDPHSDVLANAFTYIPQSEVVRAWSNIGLIDVPNPAFVIPDQGATKKAETWIQGFPKVPVYQGLKHRDMRTGALSGFSVPELPTNADARPIDLIIVDDICDAGGTFLGLAEVISRGHPGISSATLAVTHGLFTKGTEGLSKVFSRIFTVGNGVSLSHSLSYREIYAKSRKV